MFLLIDSDSTGEVGAFWETGVGAGVHAGGRPRTTATGRGEVAGEVGEVGAGAGRGGRSGRGAWGRFGWVKKGISGGEVVVVAVGGRGGIGGGAML